MELKAAFFLGLSKKVKEKNLCPMPSIILTSHERVFGREEQRDKQQKRQSGFFHGSSIASRMK
jgi:hypothetical protein